MLPGRLGLRFALEALFLVLLAIGAGLADLRPALIVLVMGVAWILVAVVEFTAERIAASPTSYLLPPAVEPQEGEPEQVFWPRPEERTVVAPPERPPAPPAVESEPEPEPEPVEEQVEEPARGAGARVARAAAAKAAQVFCVGREREPEQSQPSPPRHVKLLPRRSAPQPSRAAQEVAELFGSGDEGDPPKPEESGA